MNLKNLLRLSIVFILLAGLIVAHEEEEKSWEERLVETSINNLYITTAIIAAMVLLALFIKKKSERMKWFLFLGIAVPTVLSTLFLAESTVYINMNSLTGGPVHWHAQFEIWICGEKVELVDPTGLSNKIGTEMLHEHNDDFIHIEGVVHDFEDINLHAFFEAAGGEFMHDSLIIPTNEGVIEVKNSDLCPNGQPGRLMMFVNGELNEEMDEYVIAPYSIVRPQGLGDLIKIVFDTKNLEEVNTELGVVP